MLEEPLKILSEVSSDMKKQYDKEEVFFWARQRIAEESIAFYDRIEANKEETPIAALSRALASLASATERDLVQFHATQMFTFGLLRELSLGVEVSIWTIANELMQLKQPLTPPDKEKDNERLHNLEKKLDELKEANDQW